MSTAMSMIQPFVFRQRRFFVKRDDLIDPLLSGNKYRKLYALLQTDAARYKTIVSYGGTQSNAMLSIAALCHQKGWDFHYTSKPVNARDKKQPSGNFKQALELGMQLHEVEHQAYEDAILALRSQTKDENLFVPQGGADPIAQQGIQQLAKEIQLWKDANHIDALNVITPSGTGTTAFYLATALPDSTVITTPVVGDKEYLISQMQTLGVIPDNINMIEHHKKHHFAKPYPELLNMYQALKKAGITFDLIYGALMWDTLFQYLDNIKTDNIKTGGTILYIHSGGLIGNTTMLDRYRHKKLMGA